MALCPLVESQVPQKVHSSRYILDFHSNNSEKENKIYITNYFEDSLKTVQLQYEIFSLFCENW